jgi:hypothetical protein
MRLLRVLCWVLAGRMEGHRSVGVDEGGGGGTCTPSRRPPINVPTTTTDATIGAAAMQIRRQRLRRQHRVYLLQPVGVRSLVRLFARCRRARARSLGGVASRSSSLIEG